MTCTSVLLQRSWAGHGSHCSQQYCDSGHLQGLVASLRHCARLNPRSYWCRYKHVQYVLLLHTRLKHLC